MHCISIDSSTSAIKHFQRTGAFSKVNLRPVDVYNTSRPPLINLEGGVGISDDVIETYFYWCPLLLTREIDTILLVV